LLPNEIYKKGRMTACISQMIKTEGFFSLYRGYAANTLAIIIWMSLMPKVTNFIMEQLPIYLDPQRIQEIQETSKS
jgi:hypothetical protein